MSEKNIYLRVIAGIDIMTREARWEFQSLDPQTGMMLWLQIMVLLTYSEHELVMFLLSRTYTGKLSFANSRRRLTLSS